MKQSSLKQFWTWLFVVLALIYCMSVVVHEMYAGNKELEVEKLFQPQVLSKFLPEDLIRRPSPYTRPLTK